MKRTRELDLEQHRAAVVAHLYAAAATGAFRGRENLAWEVYRNRCHYECALTGVRLLFTRDEGMHSSGWFKNPDYERCYHLSTSPLPSTILGPDGKPFATPELTRGALDAWVRAFFGGDFGKVWSESPKSRAGQEVGVWHWRLFCDAHWRPILPRKEVYSKDFTELGWKSASEVLVPDGRGLTA